MAFGIGASFSGVSAVSAAAGTLVDADNGLSVRAPGTAVLGDDAGTVGGGLLSQREIAMNGFSLALLNNNTTRIRFQSNPNPYGLFFENDIQGSVGISESFGQFLITNAVGVAYFIFSPANGSFAIGDAGSSGVLSSTLLNGECSSAGKTIGFAVTHTGVNGIFTALSSRNNSNGANARTQITLSNDLARSIIVGMGSTTNTFYPNVAFVESSGTATNLHLNGAGVAGFIVFGTGTSGAAGEKMRLVNNGSLWIGTAAGNASAKLQVDSTTQGFLPPRMTNAQRVAIAAPAIGLMVYCTDAVEGLYIFKSAGWTFVI